MRILFAYKLSNDAILKTQNVFEYDDFTNCSDETIIAHINTLQPTFIVSKDIAFLQRLSDLQFDTLISEEIEFVLIVKPAFDTSSYHFRCLHTIVVDSHDDGWGDVRALQYVETLNHKNLAIPTRWDSVKQNATVAFIGAGIVNLVTAVFLLKKGYTIEVYDSAPEPYNDQRWEEYGCTLSGKDARIFSFNESRHHHFKGNPFLTGANDQYRKIVADGGWLCCPPTSLNSHDQTWIDEYESYPQWLAEKINREVVDLNKESYCNWLELIREFPEFFENTGYINRLLRVYTTPQNFEKGKKTEAGIGSVLRSLKPEAVANEFECFDKAIHNDAISGALEVVGFSMNVHKLVQKLVAYLIRQNVRFFWNKAVSEILYNDHGEVSALRSKTGLITADCYVVSPGVPRNDLLAGTLSHRMIGAMLGTWLTIPNIDPQLKYPLKVSRTGYAADESAAGANVIPAQNSRGENLLHVSSGHGFLGLNPHNIHKDYIKDLSRTVHLTAQRLFPDSYKMAQEMGYLDKMQYCIRPWTASCLGIFETIPAINHGKLIITGGHNTGGFAHSGAVANAVLQAFDGKYHVMHILYHPNRLRSFFDAKATLSYDSNSQLQQRALH